MEKNIQIIEQKTLDELEVNIAYLKVKCNICGNYWGVTVKESKIPQRALICNTCAGDEKFHQKLK